MPSAGAATLAVARRDLGVQVTLRSNTRELVTADLSDAWAEHFESLPPVRVPRAFKSQRNFAGAWWFATTGTHVAFESWLERDHLMLLDFAPEVVAVAAQPFTAVLPTASGPRKHTPDYFVRMADGTGVVIDVRPDRRAAKDAEMFDATADACALVGWDYQRLGDIDLIFSANVRWLSGYRHPRCRNMKVAEVLLDEAAASGHTVGTLACAVGDPVMVLPCLFHRRTASRAHRNAPSTFTSTTRRMRAASRSATVVAGATIPALFTSPRSGPASTGMAPNRPSTWSSAARSTGTACAHRSSAWHSSTTSRARSPSVR